MIFRACEETEVGSVVSRRIWMSRVCLGRRAGWAARDNSVYLLRCVDGAQKVPETKLSRPSLRMRAAEDRHLHLPSQCGCGRNPSPFSHESRTLCYASLSQVINVTKGKSNEPVEKKNLVVSPDSATGRAFVSPV